jgi:hypothetical protein
MTRRNAGHDTIGLDANVLAADLDKFDRLIPIRGAYTALIVTGLTEFLREIRRTPELIPLINADIEYHLHTEFRDGPQRTIAIRIPAALQTTLFTIFPQWGATSWFVRRLLANFVAVAEEHSFSGDIQQAMSKFTAALMQPNLF